MAIKFALIPAFALLLAGCVSVPPPDDPRDFWTGVISFTGGEFQLNGAQHHLDGKVDDIRHRCISGAFPRAVQQRAAALYEGKRVVIVADLMPWPTDAVFVVMKYRGSRISDHWCGGEFAMIGRAIGLEEAR